MNDRTDELRDLFTEVTGEETVTESQSDDRGSLADVDEAAVDDRVRSVIDRLRDHHDFDTSLDDDALVRVVRAVYDGDDDATIAADIDVSPEVVFAARMDLHLLTDDDTDLPVPLDEVRAAVERGDADPEALADDLDADPETVERALRVARTQERIRTVSRRFRSEFEDALPEAALAVSLTDSVTEDGLDEAAEDIETDTQF
ncbi:hypothetical protein [Halorientalis marina]|uniref:hypothetical protein n=1 Tax=Halorientalis marina TaxID=2931976 RepID=UPI001FF17129|nr:hypothetical protein [Halorientalis marina]